MSVTNLVDNLRIRSKWFISAARFGEQAGIPYSGWGRIKPPYNERNISKDFGRSALS